MTDDVKKKQEDDLDLKFEDWKKEYGGILDKLEVSASSEVKEYQIICKGTTKKTFINDTPGPCNNILRYEMCDGQIYVVKKQEEPSFFGLPVGFGESFNPLLYRRVIPYLLENGCITCEQCGKVYLVFA